MYIAMEKVGFLFFLLDIRWLKLVRRNCCVIYFFSRRRDSSFFCLFRTICRGRVEAFGRLAMKNRNNVTTKQNKTKQRAFFCLFFRARLQLSKPRRISSVWTRKIWDRIGKDGVFFTFDWLQQFFFISLGSRFLRYSQGWFTRTTQAQGPVQEQGTRSFFFCLCLSRTWKPAFNFPSFSVLDFSLEQENEWKEICSTE